MYYYIFIFIILVIIYLYPSAKKKIIPKKKTREEKCRDIIEEYFDRKFPKIRHELLINPSTKRKLELDCYSRVRFKKYYNGIAFEVDGEQHYYYNRVWHKNKAGFTKQIERDKIKNELCKKNGILLIRIPYYIDDIKTYIINQLNLEISNS